MVGEISGVTRTEVLIPFQFGYVVNVSDQYYIVNPAKAGIHSAWLDRTW